ncbi:hypothetical protein LOK49_LG14G00623 [Camellia lanceoleosa]|uniref:Uncharacterized protein n=1 Tax=Camellia lanceoleosa TaxID=1840588 RepID=A0ACC0F968_9ERIC|nr:hypothetical protein LOK49_LG14G00623 [Camellia lanceoleosa]
MVYDLDSVLIINNRFGVESAPAIVFLKEHGIKPVVYLGPANNSWFVDIMEQNKHQGVQRNTKVYIEPSNKDCIAPRSAIFSSEAMATAAPLNWEDQAQNSTKCMQIQEAPSTVDKDQPSSLAAVALKEKWLIFTWIDGEAQQVSPFVCQRAKTPALVLEDADPIWSQSTHRSQSNNQTQLSKKDDEDRPNQRRKKRAVSNQDRPHFITDTEPKDVYQMPLSDSDSE